MATFKNDRLLRTIWGEPVEMTPIWIMRQAGRYLPEYRKVREKAGSFMKLCQTPELACEVTLQPLKRYALDAAILFSDILTIPEAMGLGLQFIEGKGPLFMVALDREEQIRKLAVPDLEKLQYVYEAIRLTNHELSLTVPLIGFCGSPWTLAAYMLEGRAKPGFPKAFKLLEEAPFVLHHLLDVLAQAVTAHLNAQITAGAHVVMLFDTWGGLLNTPNYHEFSLYYIKQITAGLLRNYNNNKIPVILFTKDGSQWLETMIESGCDVIGIDQKISLHEAREKVGSKTALQGNMDPTCLLATPDSVRDEVATILQSYGEGPGHIFNLAHGITPDVPPEQVQVLVESVHELSKQYHRKTDEKEKAMK